MRYQHRHLSIIATILVLMAGLSTTLTAQKPAPANPLQNLLQKVFRAKQAPAKPAAENPAGKKTDENSNQQDDEIRDQIDARLPISREITGPISKLETFIGEQKWEKALNSIQELTEYTIINHKTLLKEDSFHRNADGELISARSAFLELLKQFPDEYRTRFTEKNALQAAQLFNDAKQSNQLADYAIIANWFFHTPAGHQAADYLGTVHMDRGEFAMAAYWFKSLLTANDPLTETLRWKNKAALTFQLAGQTESAKAMLTSFSPLSYRQQSDSAAVDEHRAELLEILTNHVSSGHPLIKEYWQHNNSTTRTSASAYTQPLLLPRWQVPLTEHQPIIETISMLNADLKDTGRALIPASLPITVQGKVAFRTLNGIRIVDQSSGETLWQTDVDISAEEILALGPQHANYAYYPYSHGSSQTADFHPLTNLIYRDLVYGTLSSDGERLFALENLAVLSNARPGSYTYSRAPNDPYRRDWATNKITAYNLDTGRPVWEVGGPQNNELFDLPLAGHYFFGAPVVAGEELYVIGEKEREVRLHVLDRITGKPVWSQLLAYADVPIDRDIGRRWWSAQANVESGVIICPTTLGWLVAVDRVNQRLLWAQRYTKPVKPNTSRRTRGRNVAVPSSSLNTEWIHPAPIIAQNKIIFTPPEHDELFCFDLHTGKKIWDVPKNNSEKLFAAGIYGNTVLCANKESISAFSLQTGKLHWIHHFDQHNGMPAGKGLSLLKSPQNQQQSSGSYHAAPNLATHYLLPMSSQKLILIDLDNGHVTETFQYDKPLGNLAWHHGRICSLSSTELTCFEDLDQLLAEIDQSKQKNPIDAWALWQESRILQKHGRLQPALDILRGIATATASPQLASRIRDSHLEVLSDIIRNDSANHTTEITELNGLVQTQSERLTAKLLVAEHLLKQHKYHEALEIYWDLSDWPPSMLARLDSARVTVQLDNWLAAQIQHVWEIMPLNERAFMDERISNWAGEIKQDNLLAQRKFLKLFAFHPEALAIQKRLALHYQNSGAMASAEQELQQLLGKNAAETNVITLESLADICRNYNFNNDALHYLKLLKQRYPGRTLSSGETIETVISKLSQTEQDQPASRLWQQGVQIEHFGTSNSNQLFSIDPSASELPFYRDHDFKLAYNQQRLIIRNIHDGSLFWSVPLRYHNRSRSSNDISIKPVGLHLLVYYRGYIQCLSLLDKKILWSMSSDFNLSASNVYTSYRSYRGRSRNISYPAMLTSQNSAYFAFTQAFQSGALCAANEHYICVRGTRSLSVHDTISGELLWKHDSIPQKSQILCTHDVVFIKSANNNIQAHRFLDGKPLSTADIQSSLTHAIATVDDKLITIDSKQVQAFHPLTNQIAWTHKLPNSKVHWQLINDNQLVIILPDGQLQQIELSSGQIRNVGQVPQNLMNNQRQLYTIADNQRMYVIVNNSTSGNFYQEQLVSIRIRGYLLAFDTDEQKQLWQQKVSEQYLVVEQFANMPVLLFVTRKMKRVRNSSYWAVHLLVKDKHSGNTWYDGLGSINNGYSRLQVNLADQYIAMRSYNQAIRIRAAHNQTPDNQTPDKPSDPKDKKSVDTTHKLPPAIRNIIADIEAEETKPEDNKNKDSAESAKPTEQPKPNPENQLQNIIDKIQLK